MGRLTSLVSLAGVTMGAIVSAQSLSPADVQSAINLGKRGKTAELTAHCLAEAGFRQSMKGAISGGIQPIGSFDVTVTLNAGRIASLAASAARVYKPFTPADVPDALKAPAMFIDVMPQGPRQFEDVVAVASPIDHIVLKSKAKSDFVIQPDHLDTHPVEWSNLAGATVHANRGLARFPVGAVRELPVGDFVVTVITQAGERQCTIGAKDRARLFGVR